MPIRDSVRTRDSALAPLRHRPFRFLAIGRAATMLGNAVAPIALAFAVLDLTGSVRDLGLVVGARSLTHVLFLLFGGVLADRLPRQAVMVVSCTLAAATQAAVAALVLTGTATIPALIALSALNGVLAAFAWPAAAALVPQTVPAELLQSANALNRLGANAAMIGGASLGGVLVAGVGPGWGLAVDAATFALAGLAFAGVRVAPVARRVAAERGNPLRDLREGWTEFVARSWVWVVVLGFLLINFAYVSSVNVLGPVVADETIGRTAWGLVLAAQTAGMVLGALVALRIRVRRLLLLGVLCMFADVLLLLGLAWVPSVAVLLVAAVVAGLAVEQFSVAWETSMQQNIPADRLARVYSYDALGSFLAIPLGQIASGPLAEQIGETSTLLVAAGIVFVAVLGMLADPGVRRLSVRLPDHTGPADPAESAGPTDFAGAPGPTGAPGSGEPPVPVGSPVPGAVPVPPSGRASAGRRD
ncbi:MFS transporter [Micromonospora sp. WMMD1102]|uniref:MFS transporter n=1 Tax=Micromonospora sp. WMMD1102 TaxID=3016105 RepID=UPI0024157B3D|nr:MFS transporter [Micromonospora sp. WMMD1102]MDG4790733.1 MFS transporter [Micromonospora sp. WMMD1102]MDG4792180.1 MFS transporter [Micromonospora sp. WMMD1102]